MAGRFWGRLVHREDEEDGSTRLKEETRGFFGAGFTDTGRWERRVKRQGKVALITQKPPQHDRSGVGGEKEEELLGLPWPNQEEEKG